MKSILLHIALTLLAALTGVGLIVYGDSASKEFLRRTLQTEKSLQALQNVLYSTHGEILQNTFTLYYDYDRINDLLRQADAQLQELHSTPRLQSRFYRQTRTKLQKLEKEFRHFKSSVQRYLTLNASLKNSVIYLPTLQLRFFKLFTPEKAIDEKILLLVAQINASIFLARNAQDPDFLAEIRRDTHTLETLQASLDQEKQKRLLHAYLSHLQHFLHTFPPFLKIFDQLTQNRLLGQTGELLQIFRRDSAVELKQINQTSRLLLLLYLASLLVVVFLLVKTYRENRILKRLHNELERSLVTDALTGLGNRLAYREAKKRLRQPALVLVNIDRFKHINEFYGSPIGDKVLRQVAQRIEKLIPTELEATLFRMGGDDFALLFEREHCHSDLVALLARLYDSLSREEIWIKKLRIDLDFTLGASDKSDWLFETADMALKSAKGSNRQRYAVYDASMDQRKAIRRNIETLRVIRQAIDQRELCAHFQPIYNAKSQTVERFESLARIIRHKGQIVHHPVEFIRQANEAKLSGEITWNILRTTLSIIEKYDGYSFSINLSADDIHNRQDRERILELLKKHRKLCPRLSFEILESEEISDYELAGEFIASLKSLGCQIAIDDFGSGYSNFEKILQLDIDLIKVDGSLIRSIDKDRHAELIVGTILAFAQEAGLKTVAEFVHSKSVFDKTVAMGFDYLQGYYIGKPSGKPEANFSPPPSTGSKSS